jgi:hypothetical protein
MGSAAQGRALRKATWQRCNNAGSTTNQGTGATTEESGDRERNPNKGFRSLLLRLDERFSLFEKLQESYPFLMQYEVFEVNRSYYRYCNERPKLRGSYALDFTGWYLRYLRQEEPQ